MNRVTALRLLLISVFLALWPASPTFAAAGDDIVPIVVENDGTAITLTPVVVTILTGLVLPVVIGLLYRVANIAGDRARAIVAIVVAALTATVERAITVDGSAVFSRGLVLDVLLVYGPQLLVYLGVYRQFALTRKLAPRPGLEPASTVVHRPY